MGNVSELSMKGKLLHKALTDIILQKYLLITLPLPAVKEKSKYMGKL